MIAWFATKGSGTNEAQRIEALLSSFANKQEWLFDKGAKGKSLLRLLKRLRHDRPSLIVMEGTGIAGGFVCLAGRLVWGIPYIFSSGDAVGPFVAGHFPMAGPLFRLYERALCRLAAGFIGWTPYLCGRAMTYGCHRSVTAAGWPIAKPTESKAAEWRKYFRQNWGIPDGALVIGLVGSLEWNAHRRYCYGLDLVSAAKRLHRDDIIVVIVGDGSGLEHLRRLAGEHLGKRVRLPGAVPLSEVFPCLAAFDVASLPQSTDGIGAFRYTTKLSEYAAAGLPVITSRIPASYDVGTGWMWRLPGRGPWTGIYINALTELLEALDLKDIAARRVAVPLVIPEFDRESQISRVTEFIEDIVGERSAESTCTAVKQPAVALVEESLPGANSSRVDET